MTDENPPNPLGQPDPTTAAQSSVHGRRMGERRKAIPPIDEPDRRKGERRSGKDRRTSLWSICIGI